MEEGEHENMMMSSRTMQRRKSSIGITSCFTGATQHHRRASFDAAATSYSTSQPSPRRAPSNWFKCSRTNNDLPETKGKCRSFISRVRRHRRHSSADFSYDPLSYALNFDDDSSSSTTDEEFRAVNFNARLPVSPPSRNSTPPPIPRSIEVYGSDDLRRGFEALSASLKTTTSPLRSNNATHDQLSSSPVAVGEVDVANPVGISANREILIMLN